ncbi:hypothetical protein [Methylobacter sp. S3L5C]|uniref:hypothetical protein n=1 Tax=Methylobacter sp. S3L5C TaxID=2839024 RepID=UPI001FACF36E|nr:hypothetical protein [Methylobacter sp. S3L5C]UOA08339.1 hypothetical protein KKZ03_19385 [Methylobacter sp. S3L5C]
MPIDHIDSWGQFGLSGLVIAALFAFIWFLVKEHKAERQEWIVAYREQTRLVDDRQVETNNVIRELVSVVRESNAHHR